MPFIIYSTNNTPITVLLIFQALDAAGKDSTIRKVFRSVNPAGFQVHSFKQPSPEEFEHDFLWQTQKRYQTEVGMALLL